MQASYDRAGGTRSNRQTRAGGTIDAVPSIADYQDPRDCQAGDESTFRLLTNVNICEHSSPPAVFLAYTIAMRGPARFHNSPTSRDFGECRSHAATPASWRRIL